MSVTAAIRHWSATALLLAAAALTSPIAAGQSSRATESVLSLFPLRTVWTLALDNALIAPPAYSSTHAYFAIEGDRLVAYDWDQGRQAWLTSARPLFEPVEGDGLLFVAEAAGLKAIRTEDGKVAWEIAEAPFQAGLVVPPAFTDGSLVLALKTGEIVALGPADGKIVWRRNLASPAHARPALAAGRVYVPLEDGRLVALSSQTGEPAWERKLGGPVTAVLADGDRLFAGSRDNFFYAIRADDGSVAWRWRTGADVVGLPVVDDRNVYFVSMDNVLRALARGSGVQRWVRLLPLRPTRGPLAVGRTLVVSGIAPALPAFNMSDGTPAGDIPASGELAGPPGTVGDGSKSLPRLLVVTRDIAKGATATLFTRALDPPLTPFVPPTGAVWVIPLPGAKD